MDIVRYTSNEHLLISRIDLRNHSRSHHFSHYNRHSSNLGRSDFRCADHCIIMKLLVSNTKLLHQVIGNKHGTSSLTVLAKNQTIDNCHILHLLMRNILKHLSITISGNNFHCQLALHLIIIGKILHIDLKSVLDTGDDRFRCSGHYLVVILTILTILDCLEHGTEICIHTDVTALRSDANCIIGSIQLLNVMLTEVCINTMISKCLVKILFDSFFELFIIHSFVFLSVFDLVNPDRHPELQT